MPFVKGVYPILGHMQAADDPVRAAAEDNEPILRDQLLSVWNGMTPENTDVPDREAKLCASTLLSARAEGLAAMQSTIGQPITKALTVTYDFQQSNAAGSEQAALLAAAFVREISDEVRATLNATNAAGFAAGLPPADIARNLRESIGLTAQQAAAVQNYRRLLETGSTDALTRALRDKRFDVEPEDLTKLTPVQIDARVDAYRRRYLAYRASTIARYETLAAANGGALNSIHSSVNAGILPLTTTVGWLLAHDERTCPRCRSIVKLQPNGVPLGQLFRWRHNDRSGLVAFAPLHPLCRCTNTYRVHR
jgi:hypothetical protein